jgi:hypothetical protein
VPFVGPGNIIHCAKAFVPLQAQAFIPLQAHDNVKQQRGHAGLALDRIKVVSHTPSPFTLSGSSNDRKIPSM